MFLCCNTTQQYDTVNIDIYVLISLMVIIKYLNSATVMVHVWSGTRKILVDKETTRTSACSLET